MRDLTDAQWAILQPLLPPRNRTGRPGADDRRTLNAILYVLRTGCAWRDLPEKSGGHLAAHPSHPPRHAGADEAHRLTLRVARRQLRPGKKGGEAVGLTGRGRGSRLMPATDANGLPLGMLTTSAG